MTKYYIYLIDNKADFIQALTEVVGYLPEDIDYLEGNIDTLQPKIGEINANAEDTIIILPTTVALFNFEGGVTAVNGIDCLANKAITVYSFNKSDKVLTKVSFAEDGNCTSLLFKNKFNFSVDITDPGKIREELKIKKITAKRVTNSLKMLIFWPPFIPFILAEIGMITDVICLLIYGQNFDWKIGVGLLIFSLVMAGISLTIPDQNAKDDVKSKIKQSKKGEIKQGHLIVEKEQEQEIQQEKIQAASVIQNQHDVLPESIRIQNEKQLNLSLN